MLRQVHDAGYTHGDFHSENIMLDEQKNPKLIDFGKSQKLSQDKDDAEEELFEDYISGLAGQKLSFSRRLPDEKIEELFDQGYNNSGTLPAVAKSVPSQTNQPRSSQEQLQAFLTGKETRTTIKTPEITAYIRKKQQELEGKVRQVLELVTVEVPANLQGKGVFRDFFNQLQELNPYDATTVSTVVNPDLYDSLDRKGFSLQSDQEASFYRLKDQPNQAGIKPQSVRDKFFPPQQESMEDFFASLRANRSVAVEPYGEILKQKLKTAKKKALEFVNQIGVEAGKANNNLTGYFQEKTNQAKQFADGVKAKVNQTIKPAIPTFQAIALDIGEKTGQLFRKPEKPFLETVQDKFKLKVEELTKQAEEFLFPTTTPSLKEIFPSATERFGTFLGNKRKQVSEAMSTTIPDKADEISRNAGTSFVGRIPVVGRLASQAYGSIAETVGRTSRLFASNYDVDTQAGIGIGRAISQDKLPGKIYRGVEKLSPALAEVSVTGASGVAALKNPVQNLLSDIIRLRGNLDFSKSLTKFQTNWINSFKKVSNSVQVGKDLEKTQRAGFGNLGALASRLTFGLPGTIQRTVSKLNTGTRVSEIPGLAREAIQFTDKTDKLGNTLDEVKSKARAVGTAFKIGFTGIHKPLELLEKTGNKVFDGLGTNLKQFALGFLSFQAIRVAAGYIKTIGIEAIKAYAEFDKLKTVLNFTQGGEAGGKEALGFVRQQAKEKKIPLLSSIKGFSQLSASTRGSTISGEEVKNITKGVLSASTVLSLSSEDQAGAITALSQMASKGKASSEELRQQLGERIPGAIGIAARSMQMSEQQFTKTLELGLIPASELLPKLGRQLEIEFGGAAKTASNNVVSSMYGVENSVQELKITMGETLAPIAKTALNVFSAGLDFVNGQLQKTDGNLTKLASSGGLALLGTALGMFTAGIGSFSLLNIAIMGLSTAIGFVMRVGLPFMAQFVAINAVLTTMSTIWNGITDKGGDMAKFADDAAERLKKIEEAAGKANKELDDIANRKYGNIFDELGHSLEGTTSGKNEQAHGKRALTSGGVIAGGAAATGGFAAFQLAGGATAGIPAVLAALPIAIASAVGGVIGGIAGYGINRGVMGFRTGGQDTSYYGWGEKKRDDRQIAAADAGENIGKLIEKGYTYIGTDQKSERDPITRKKKLEARGALATVQEIDKQIAQESKAQAARPDTDIQGRKEGQERLRKLNVDRTEKSRELTEFQAQLSGTMLQLKEQIANEQDAGVKQKLEVRLGNAQKLKDQMDSINATNADPLIKFAAAITQVGIALEEAERKGRNFLNAQNLIVKQSEAASFGTDQFAGQKSAVATAKNQYKSIEREIADRQKTQGELKQQLENPELQGLLQSRGITKETTIGELKSKLKEEESKSGAQKDSKYTAILEAQIQYKEEEDKVTERRLQLADAGLQVKQAEEADELARIDERTKVRQTGNEKRTAIKNQEITKAVGSGKLREGAASNARADNELQGAKNEVADIEAQLADLEANRGKLSAKEYIQRERDLSKQLIESRTKVAEKSNEIEKNRLDNQMNDIKNYYSDVKTITEGRIASGAITPEEGAKKNLDIIDSQSKAQLAAIADERKRIGTKNPELTRKLDVKEAEVYKQQQEAVRNYSQERQGQINTKFEAERAREERAFTDGKKSFESFNESRLQSTLKNADEIDKVLAEQRKRTPAKNKLALDEISKQESENHKKRIEGYRQYFDELTQLSQSKYQALIGIEENRFALGEVGADEFFGKRLELAEESLDKQEELLAKKRKSPLGKDPREKVKIDNEQNEINKKRLDNLRQFFEERQNLVKSQIDADSADLEADRAEGTITDETFLDTRLQKQQDSSSDERQILAERKSSKLGLDPRELAKIEAEEANIRKRDIDNLKTYYDERDALEKQRTEVSMAQLRSQLETGATTAKDYYEQQYNITLEGIKKQRDVLAERKADLGDNPEELRKIEQQEAELTERQSKAAKERYDNLNNLLEQSLTEANNTAKLAETQRILDAEAIFNKDRTVPRQIALEAERLKAQTDRINIELQNEEKRNEELKKVRFSNPIDEQKQIADVQGSDQKILDLTKQRIDNQISLEDNHKEAVKRSVDEALEARKLSTEQAVALAEQEKNAQDLVIASLDRKGKLLKSKTDLTQAQDALREFRGQSEADKFTRALDLRKRLDNKELAPEARTVIQNQLAGLGFNESSSELDILNKKHDAENRLAKIQEQAKLRQLKLSQQQAELDNLRNIQLASQAVKQAEINQLQAGGNVINAQKQLNDALTAKVKDPVAIAAAEQAVRISQMQAEASTKQVADKKAELATTLEIASEQKSILANQAELTREQIAKADADRKSAQALEKADAATSNIAKNTKEAGEATTKSKNGFSEMKLTEMSFSSMQKRFKGGSVAAGQPYIVGEDPSTGDILPSSEIFVPQVAGRILSARETREILLPKIFKQDILNPVTAKESGETTIQNNNQPVVNALADLKNLIANRKPQLDANFTLVNEVDPTSKVLELQRKMMFSLGV
ncbi:MAG TPA: tape measure protein [Phormidium sp.]